MALVVKNPPPNAGDRGDTGLIPGSRRSPKEGKATHSSIYSWRIPRTEDPGGLQSMGHKESDMTEVTEHATWKETPVFPPGEFHGQRILVGYSPWISKSQTWLKWLSMRTWKETDFPGEGKTLPAPPGSLFCSLSASCKPPPPTGLHKVNSSEWEWELRLQTELISNHSSHLSVACSWANCMIALCFHFPLCKMALMISNLQCYWRSK